MQQKVDLSVLASALDNVFGPQNTSLVVRYLEQENVVRDGTVDMLKLELALKSLFGQSSDAIIHTLVLAPLKKNIQSGNPFR
jgi:hypothetical protein